MNNSPSPGEIITALSQSGYLMEQRVATQLESLGLHIWTNWAFEDVDEGESREIDVRAIKRVANNEGNRLGGFLEILAECKNNSSPLVFIGRPRSAVDNLNPPEEIIFPIGQYTERRQLNQRSMQRDKDAFFHLGFDQVHYEYLTNVKAVQFCRIDRQKQKWQAHHGDLYDSIFYPIAKALTARKRELSSRIYHSKDTRYFWIFAPIVVTNGDIFFVDSTKSNPVPEKRSYITFKRDIQAENLKGTFAVNFMHQDHIGEFFAECLQPLVDKVIDLSDNRPNLVLTSNIPWET